MVNSFFKINRKAQQSSFGMSFGMIFSIILIIFFIASAFVVIGVFLNFKDDVDSGQFYENLQDEIDAAWISSGTTKTFKINLNEEITHVCFANLSNPITGNRQLYDQIEYSSSGQNLFLIPQGAAGNLASKSMDHLDIQKITENQNPYCVTNPGEVKIIKPVRSKFVIIE